MIRQHMVSVICVYGQQTGRTEAGLPIRGGYVGRYERRSYDAVSCGQFQCIHRCGGTRGRRKQMKTWLGNKEQGRARTGGYVEEERDGEGEPHNHLHERTAQDIARPTGGAATAAKEGEGPQSVGRRVCHHKTQTGCI